MKSLRILAAVAATILVAGLLRADPATDRQRIDRLDSYTIQTHLFKSDQVQLPFATVNIYTNYSVVIAPTTVTTTNYDPNGPGINVAVTNINIQAAFSSSGTLTYVTNTYIGVAFKGTNILSITTNIVLGATNSFSNTLPTTGLIGCLVKSSITTNGAVAIANIGVPPSPTPYGLSFTVVNGGPSNVLVYTGANALPATTYYNLAVGAVLKMTPVSATQWSVYQAK
jgi:hypothetical protein